MLFLGDIACPATKVAEFTECIKKIPVFDNEIVVLNLEATITDDNQSFDVECLFNSKHVLDGFVKAEKVIVSLANNHVYDFPERIKPTVELLERHGVGIFGLCKEHDRILPYEYETTNGQKLAFFGHCWRLYTQTNPNKINSIRVVDHNYEDFMDIVTDYIQEHVDTKVYCFMHWNYDMEKLPFPMHIDVSRKLIDNGVSGVIGSHSHRVQAAEIYKGCPIVYGLGNFYIPSYTFFSKKLVYPEISKDTYALVVNAEGAYIQWFRTDDIKFGAPIVLAEKESFDGVKIAAISRCLKLDKRQYMSYFRKNRLKKLLVPVFSEYKGSEFRIKEFFAICRVKLIKRIKG